MHSAQLAARKPHHTQFGLLRLMEFVTICAIVFTLSGTIGVAPSILLAMMALALAMRSGPVSLLMLASASLAADWPAAAGPDYGLLRQFIVILFGALLCTWFRLHGLRKDAVRP